MDNTKMLRKVEQTADVILDMFPDVELAVTEGEPELATVFFNLVKVCVCVCVWVCGHVYVTDMWVIVFFS
jgi:hypothetical protein